MDTTGPGLNQELCFLERNLLSSHGFGFFLGWSVYSITSIVFQVSMSSFLLESTRPNKACTRQTLLSIGTVWCALDSILRDILPLLKVATSLCIYQKVGATWG